MFMDDTDLRQPTCQCDACTAYRAGLLTKREWRARIRDAFILDDDSTEKANHPA